jgi:hypothetical protein
MKGRLRPRFEWQHAPLAEHAWVIREWPRYDQYDSETYDVLADDGRVYSGVRIVAIHTDSVFLFEPAHESGLYNTSEVDPVKLSEILFTYGLPGLAEG